MSTATEFYGYNRDGSLKTREQVLEQQHRMARRSVERVKGFEAEIESLEGKILTLKIRIAQEVEDLKEYLEIVKELERE